MVLESVSAMVHFATVGTGLLVGAQVDVHVALEATAMCVPCTAHVACEHS